MFSPKKDEVKVEDLSEKLSAAEVRRRLEIAKREEAERIARLKVIEQRQSEERKLEMDRAREEAAAAKEEVKKQAEKERVERLLKLQSLTEKEAQEKAKRLAARDEIENRLKGSHMIRFLHIDRVDVPSAIKCLKQRYGLHKMREVLEFLVEVIRKIINRPDFQPYRRLSKSNKIVEKLILEHVGASAILRHIGFEDDPETPAFFFRSKETSSLKEECEKLKKVIYFPRTRIREILDAGEMKGRDEDQIVFSLLTLRRFFDNIVVNPSSTYTRTMLLSSDEYQSSIKDTHEAQGILGLFGFKQDSGSWTLPDPDVGFLRKGIEDLDSEIKLRCSHTTVWTALENCNEGNDKSSLNRVVSLILGALDKVVNQPHDTRFHRIDIKKLFVCFLPFF